MDQPRIKRNHRRNIALVALAVVVSVLFIGAVTQDVLAQRITMESGAAHAPALPENVYRPTRYLTGVADAGPPGRLALIAEKIEGEEYFGPWFGVSATTGEYRFLDLPDMAEGVRMRLSPDGRRIAYWMTGTTAGATWNPVGSSGFSYDERPITGIAIYNTEDGSVVRNSIPSAHGLAMDQDYGGMYWLSDQNLAYSYQEIAGDDAAGSFAEGGGVVLWYDVDAEPVKTRQLAPDGERAPSFLPAYPPTTFVRDNHFDPPVEVDDRGRETGRIAKALPVGSDLTWSGNRLVRIGGDYSGGQLPQVEVGRAVGTSLVRFAALSGFRAEELLGWRSADTVLAVGEPGGGGESHGPYGLYAINIDDHTFRHVGVSEGFHTQFAVSLLGEPTVPGREPPSVWRLLLTTRVLLMASGLLGLAVLILLRRRT